MSKFLSLKQLSLELNSIRQGKTIVFVSGCFDIIHTQHIKFLQIAKSKGDILLLGLESDQRVKQLKGRGRPINNFAKRLENLQKAKIADYIFPIPKNFNNSLAHEALIAKLRPHILAVSSHTLHQDKKKEIIERYGGKLRIVLAHDPSISSTSLLAKNKYALDKKVYNF